jgi:alpha-tubulin suppressor-like RCC1 family protein
VVGGGLDAIVVPVAAGTATVTVATADGSKTAACEVTVLKAVTGATIAAGLGNSVAIKADGSLWEWGRYEYARWTNIYHVEIVGVFDEPIPAQRGTAKNWAAVSSDGGSNLALGSNASLWTWGRNSSGQLNGQEPEAAAQNGWTGPTQVSGSGTVVAASMGYSFHMRVMADGSLWRCGSSTNSSVIAIWRVGLLNDWAAVSAGLDHTLALKTDGSLWAWGSNASGKVGIITDDATLYRSPNRVDTASDWVAVAAGYGHSLALKSDGSLWAWGLNDCSQLGLGSTTNKNTPTIVSTGFRVPAN